MTLFWTASDGILLSLVERHCSGWHQERGCCHCWHDIVLDSIRQEIAVFGKMALFRTVLELLLCGKQVYLDTTRAAEDVRIVTLW